MFPELPPRRNTPPRIVNWSPADLRTIVLVGATAGASCATGFVLSVEEEDATDVLKSQWFIDRTPSSPSFLGAANPDPKSPRTLLAPASLLAQLGSYVDSQRHIVEAFVTDSDFTETVGQAADRVVTLADGGTLVDHGYEVTKAWFVEVQRCQ